MINLSRILFFGLVFLLTACGSESSGNNKLHSSSSAISALPASTHSSGSAASQSSVFSESASALSSSFASSGQNAFANWQAASVSKLIAVDQLGYLPAAEKVAVFRAPVSSSAAIALWSEPQGHSISIINTQTDEVVLTKTLRLNNAPELVEHAGNLAATVGENIGWLSFSELKSPGTYVLVDEANNLRSVSFNISDDVYVPVLKKALRSFYYQRANTPKESPFAVAAWLDDAGHVGNCQDASARDIDNKLDAASEKNLTGGWYASVDYNRYTLDHINTLLTLLHAYEENPSAWRDDANIPESGNGIADVIDEIRWGLNWLKKMQNDNGSVLSFLQASTTNANGGQATSPANARGCSYYGSATANITYGAAATFALAAHVFSKIHNDELQSEAKLLHDNAKNAWQWATKHHVDAFAEQPVVETDNPLVIRATTGSEHMPFIAGLYMEVAFGKGTYFIDGGGLVDLTIDKHYPATNRARLYYHQQLNDGAGFLKDSYSMQLQLHLGNNAMSIKGEQLGYNISLPTPEGMSSNYLVSETGALFANMASFGLDNAAATAARTANYLHYLHGVNPLSQVYISNLASLGVTNSVSRIYHPWFSRSNALAAPGFLVAGPSPEAAGYCFLAPQDEGKIACDAGFPDFRTWFYLRNYAPYDHSQTYALINHTNHTYQASYLRLLSKFVNAENLWDFSAASSSISSSMSVSVSSTASNSDASFSNESSTSALPNRSLSSVSESSISSISSVASSADAHNALWQEAVISNLISVDQFGYLPFGKKRTVVRTELPVTPLVGASHQSANWLQLINVETNEVVQEGTGSYLMSYYSGRASLQVKDLYGGYVWEFDFSSLQTPGVYTLFNATANIRSPEFSIGQDIYKPILKEALRTFYYQRAGFAKELPYAELGWTDSASHIGECQDANARSIFAKDDAETERDLSGGWYNGSEYHRYTSQHAKNLIMLLFSYVEAPKAWSDDNNLPDSGNGIPDILDEIKWGVDWLVKMQNDDGSVLSLLAASHVNAQGKIASPPSSATGCSYYGAPSMAATMDAAAAFAFAAKVLKDSPYSSLHNYADDLIARAENAWHWGELREFAQDEDIVYSDLYETSSYFPLNASAHQGAAGNSEGNRHWFAANFLYWATGADTYKDVRSSYASFREGQGIYTVTELYDDYLRIQTGEATSNNDLTLLNQYESSLYEELKNSTREYSLLEESWYYGAYLHARSEVKGSNFLMADKGSLYMNVYQYNVGGNIGGPAEYRDLAAGYLHYLHGTNPLGIVYLTNMAGSGAHRSVNEVFHAWFFDGSDWDAANDSRYGPAPGFLVSGPNRDYPCPQQGGMGPCTAEPHPSLKARTFLSWYLEINDPASVASRQLNDYELSYQVAYLRLLSKFVGE